MKNIASRIKLIRVLFPESRESDLSGRLEKLNAVANKNKGANMTRNKDYRQGYEIGEYLSVEGEDLDFKDLDQTANELLEELDWGELSVNDIESFKDGLANGFTLSSYSMDK